MDEETRQLLFRLTDLIKSHDEQISTLGRQLSRLQLRLSRLEERISGDDAHANKDSSTKSI